MPKKDEKNLPNINSSKKEIDKINNNMERLLFDFNKKYQHDENINELNKKLNDINKKYKNITGNNVIEFLTSIELNNMRDSKNRVPINTNNVSKNIQQLMQDSMTSIYFNDEKERLMRYDDYRLIDAYIPELAKCLDIYRDCILSPDDVTKRSLNYYYKDSLVSEQETKMISKNLLFLDKEYRISKDIKNQIREALLLGDLFTIILDINKETEKMLKEDEIFVNENYNYGEIVNEASICFEDFKDFEKLFEDITDKSKNKEENKTKRMDKAKKEIVDAINNNIKFYKNPLDLLSDKKKFENKNHTKLDLKGSIVKIPCPENIIKIELDHHVLGYIYIEKSITENYTSESGLTNRSINNMNRLMNYKNNDIYNSRYDFLNSDNNLVKNKFDLITDIFVRGISKKLDNKFINDNKDFKRLIYTLLKQEYITEKQVFITFLQPNEVCHMKLDSNDVYGISKYAKSLFAAKIYLATLITNLMQKVSRGRDKRAFYVDTSADLDYEGTVQSFVRDIKSKEITSDILRSVSTVINSVGAFEDYYIPTIDGEKPIEIDTVSGMDVEVDNDFLNNLLKSAISGTGVPANYIEDIAQVDYARTLAMQNQGFVRSIIGYQGDFGEYYSDIIRKLYINEFISENDKENNINVDEIFIKFPPPIYLNLTTVNDQIGNTSSTIDFLVNLYFPENSEDKNIDEKKLEFRKELISKYFLPTMDWNLYDKTFEDVELKVEGNTIENKKIKDEDENALDEDEY